ncbi:MAG: hypothetical protein ACREM6_10800 [Vulcanimicrobiaceae bacterium]
MEEVELLVVGCGPAGGTAAREAAREGVQTMVLERDAVVGQKRVCAAGLRPGFCADFDLPSSIIHCNPETLSCFGLTGRKFDFPIGVGHTTTREELDGTIAELARRSGAEIRTSALFRSYERGADRTIVEYADLAGGGRQRISARHVFFAQGSSARWGAESPFAYGPWGAGLITCYQYRVYLERPADPIAYGVLEMHYYRSPIGNENIIAWMFPKRDHLSIGLGMGAKVDGKALRAELDAFLARIERRLFAGVPYSVREEGNLLYGGLPRPQIGRDGLMLGGTAAGLVDATTGEGIHEAAVSGRLASQAVVEHKRGRTPDAAAHYERTAKQRFYGRLYHRFKLMNFLERRPARFDVLFGQIERERRLCDLLQRDRNDFSLGEWLYLYAQAALFGIKAIRA